jgi:hypothetical protein
MGQPGPGVQPGPGISVPKEEDDMDRAAADAVAASLKRPPHLLVDVLDYSNHNHGRPWFLVTIRDARDRTRAYTVTPDGAHVHLFGEMDLPLCGYDHAWTTADRVASQCGYIARRNRAARSITCYGQEGEVVEVVYGADDRLISVRSLS